MNMRLSNITQEQLVVRKDIDVNEHGETIQHYT